MDPLLLEQDFQDWKDTQDFSPSAPLFKGGAEGEGIE